VKFNHLLPKSLGESNCNNTEKLHQWKPVRVRAVQGNYMSIVFVCKRCKERAGSFISHEQYELHAENLERECEI